MTLRETLSRQARRLPAPVEDVARRCARGAERAVWRRLAQRELKRRYPGVIARIDPRDEMFVTGDPRHYFFVGGSAVDVILEGLGAAHVTSVQRILDVPCGHGRVLRMLGARWPQAHLTACDINRHGVDFCARTFGAEPVYSANPISSVVTGGHFDLVWVGSLLTHLDSHRWPEMLGWFRDQLRPGGALIFSTHGDAEARRLPGAEMAAVLDRYWAEGFGYIEHGSGPVGYGHSLSSPEWARAQVEAVGGLRYVHIAERAWADHHDVVTCSRI